MSATHIEKNKNIHKNTETQDAAQRRKRVSTSTDDPPQHVTRRAKSEHGPLSGLEQVYNLVVHEWGVWGPAEVPLGCPGPPPLWLNLQ